MQPKRRNLAIEQRSRRTRFLLHDRDAKFCGPFDELIGFEGVRVLRTPVRAPRANAVAERWVRTVRNECLDHLLIVGRRHLERVLRDLPGSQRASTPFLVAGVNTLRFVLRDLAGAASAASLDELELVERPLLRLAYVRDQWFWSR